MHKTQFKGSVIVGHEAICGWVVQFKAWRFNIETKNPEKEILVTEWKCSREFSTLRERWWYMSQYSIATALVCHSCTWMISGWHPVICNKVHPTNQFQIASCWKPHLLTKKKYLCQFLVPLNKRKSTWRLPSITAFLENARWLCTWVVSFFQPHGSPKTWHLKTHLKTPKDWT